ncbi:MAG: sulfatase-like hydrolase/transferase [Polyangiaceae bacterium]|nr:sulfatase-like hydrolase/transferase [Polyangiaceae bacterium]
MRTFLDATLAALALVAAEAVLVSFLHRHQFADLNELRLGFFRVPLLAWLLAAPVAWLGALCQLLARRSTAVAPRFLLAALALLAGALQAFFVSSGRHFAALPLRLSFVALFATLTAAAAWFLAPPLARLERRSPASLGLAAAALALLLPLLNASLLPRLYPAFHFGLALLTLLLAPWIALAWVGPETHTPRPLRSLAWPAALLLGAMAGAALSVPSLQRSLTRADNLRIVIGEHAPTVGYALRALAMIEPPEATPPGPAALPEQATQPSGEGPDWRGRDLLLITVDALRADRLGVNGYPRKLTPFLDSLAAEGTLFEQAYTATPHTSYAVSSLMTGKYVRPLVLQGASSEHDTLARLLRGYGYRTSAFYPPAVFFIDGERFASLRDRGLDFEYRKVEFAGVDRRIEQVDAYLQRLRPERRSLLWVHLFEPHEPYEIHPDFPLGDRDLDRYDGEIAAVDRGVRRLVEAVRARRPGTVILFSSDHGEEFGEHGGRYHGTTVYEEQVRVPLLIHAPGLVPARRVASPVQTIDLLPTILAALRIPTPARVRGRDLGVYLRPEPPAPDLGFAFAETDESTMLAEGSLRLICARKLGACQLFDIAADPLQTRDVSAQHIERAQKMRARLREVEAAHGRYELAGLRAEGRAWPEAIRRGIAGDGDAAIEVASLLDDADRTYRRKAAEVLFELARPETAPALRLALTRDEDDQVRRWAALALTRLGEGAGRALELVEDRDLAWRRLAALALAESGDGRGEDTLVAWWQAGPPEFQRARQLLAAFARIKAKHAVVPLLRSLPDLRLRPYVAETLAQINEPAARPALLDAFANERYLPTRQALGRALITLGAGAEMAPPLARFLGAPDPLPDGLALALQGGFLPSVGGPDRKDLDRLRQGRGKTRRLSFLLPRGGNGKGLRLLVLGRSIGTGPATVRLGVELPRFGQNDDLLPVELDPRKVLEFSLDAAESPRQLALEVPAELGLKAGTGVALALWQSEQADLSALALVPLTDELPPPPPEPWTPGAGDSSDELVDDGT